MGTKALTQHLTATDRFGHTWTFNIPLLAVWLSRGQSAVNSASTLSWHVEEGGEGRETMEGDQTKNGWLIKRTYSYRPEVIKYDRHWQHSDFTVSTDPQNVCTSNIPLTPHWSNLWGKCAALTSTSLLTSLKHITIWPSAISLKY